MKHVFTALMVMLFASFAFGQTYSIKGTVMNEQTGEMLPGASLYLKALNVGGISDEGGKYEIKGVTKGQHSITVSFVGFTTKEITVNVTGDLVVNVNLMSTSYLLGETVVSGTRAKERETPIAFSEVKGADIEFKLSSRDVPHVLQQTPSIYVSNSGGGAGDSRLMVRGFDQRNTAIMINGVPVNDMENGWVYWSNWAGIGDVTNSIQVQRGLGASPYSVSSIGGVVNVLTSSSTVADYAKLKYEMGSDNLNKVTAAFKSDLGNNMGVTALISKKTWNGYVDNTNLNEFTYFFSIGGVWGNHALELQAVGSPQNHDQRSTYSTFAEYAARGRNYNPDWGYLNGKALARGTNYFHKPAFNLNHNWQISDKVSLASVLYLSSGTGGGTGTSGTAPTKLASTGLLDWDGLWAKNLVKDSVYSKTLNKSVGVLRSSHNDHVWYGILSTVKYEFNKELTLNAGIDGRYYRANHYRTIDNLIGGDYYIDGTKNLNRAKTTMLTVGDKIDYSNDGIVAQYGGFAQAEYNNKVWSAFLNVSGSNTGYQRVDFFNFADSDPNQTTAWQNFFGYTVKGGVNFNINENHNVFFNAGYFNKAPLFRNVFDNLNKTYNDPKNEKILGLELGYGFVNSFAQANVNLFYTSWKDKSIAKTLTLTNGDIFNYNIVGAEAEHKGVEFEGKLNVTKNMKVLGSFSVMNNIWKNNVDVVVVSDADPTKSQTTKSYVKDIKVGDFPQVTGSLGLELTVPMENGSKLMFNPIYTFYGQNYAYFNPDGRSQTWEGVNSWRLPDYFLVDVHVAYSTKLTNFVAKDVVFGLHIYNALNQTFISDATEGADPTGSTVKVFYGRDRWFSASISLGF